MILNRNNTEWSINNNEYWNLVAIEYDQLYLDSWSKLENEFIAYEIKQLEIENCKILDLGCGTGLGYSLCAQNSPNIHFIGLDSSTEMLKQFEKRYPSIKLTNSSMSNLTQFESEYFDIIISTFTAFSYSDDVDLSISEIKRTLKPGGKALISVISKWSLRRLLNFKFGQKERYKTRKSKQKKYAYAWAFTPFLMKKLLTKHGFKRIKIIGYNPFSGITILQKTFLWPMSQRLGRLIPSLSHELIVILKNE